MDDLISVQCYGVAWTDSAPECCECDVCQRCRKLTLTAKLDAAKTLSEKLKVSPELQEAYDEMIEEASRKKTAKEEKEETTKKIRELLPKYEETIRKNTDKKVRKKKEATLHKEEMPNFSSMSLEEIIHMARVNAIDYNNSDKRILRMQLIMKLKKLYIK